MNQFVKFLWLMAGSLSLTLTAQALGTSPGNYLVSPAGPYHVGFLDYHWLNVDACPNAFATLVNKNSFSTNNAAHCNEVQVRTYYPTDEIGSSDYVPRSSLIQVINQYYKKASPAEIEQVNKLQSFSKHKAKIIKGKYPLIFFTSGYDVSPQLYENMITNLVSYGYIVVTINSEFLNGPFALSNTTVVNSYLPKAKEQGKSLFVINWQDLSFVYKQVFDKKLDATITDSIDFDHVGLLGHSLGAGTVAHFAEQQKVQAVVGLDLAWDNIYEDAIEHDFKAPFLEIFSSQIYLKNKSVNLPYLNKEKPIRKDKFLYVLSNKLDPTQKDYTIHMSFSDQSTLASQPAINKAAIAANNSTDGRFDGMGNGWNIAAAVNQQLLLFFNRYLKGNS